MTWKSLLGSCCLLPLSAFAKTHLIRFCVSGLAGAAQGFSAYVRAGLRQALAVCDVGDLCRRNLPNSAKMLGRGFATATHKMSLAAMLLTCPIEAHAATGWSASLTIQSLITSTDGTSLHVTGDDNLPGCTQSGWLILYKADSNYEAVSASLLTAFAQGKPVKLWESSCTGDGWVHFIASWVDR